MDAISQTDLSNIKFFFELSSLNWTLSSNVNELISAIQRSVSSIWLSVILYLPLGIIGLWRWGTWVVKKIISLFYRPNKGQYLASVSVITPVYKENPATFIDALVSWAKNSPQEIIAVIDYTDKKCIKIFEDFKRVFPKAKLIVTQKYGKREALADGIKAATSDIVALVDSDTIWSENLIKDILPPFSDPKVGGVGTRQNILTPKTLAQKIFDIQLDDRYFNELPFLVTGAKAVTCLSGRTAFYRHKVILPLVDDLVSETFWGEKVISGDDKRLTYLVQASGYQCLYQGNGIVYTPGAEDVKQFLQQRIRWTRNSWRADLKALTKGWTYRYPVFVFYLLDRCIQPFTLLLSPIFFTIALLIGDWTLAIAIFIWWHISRFIKLLPHFRRRPQDISILSIFIVFNFFTSVIKIYALLTLNTQGWMTRWDKARVPQFKLFSKIPAYAATSLVFIGLAWGVFWYKQQFPLTNISAQQSNNLAFITNTEKANNPEVLGTTSLDKNGKMMVTKYVVKPGDSLARIAVMNDISLEGLLYTNISILPNWNLLDPGYVLNIPRPDLPAKFNPKYNYQKKNPDVLQVNYDPITNTIVVNGRGKSITLKDVAARVEKKQLEEVTAKNWILRANLEIRNGVMLTLNPDDVLWLRLVSSKDGFVNLRSYNSIIVFNNVKVTSWDENQNDYDRDYRDGRSYILAKDSSRMDLYNSEFAYLGYPRRQPEEDSVYGVSWRMAPPNYDKSVLTGEVLNSKFHHNYFGAYTFGATSMLWRGNEFFDNIQYGLDPHDDSNEFIVENNKFYNNGNHGLIFSKRCINNIIRNNLSYNNKLHGIMLHESSNNNLIEGNAVSGNMDGIAIYSSSNNIIRSNIIIGNSKGIRINLGSANNFLENNQIDKSKQYGLYIYDDSNNNNILSNKFQNNSLAIYLKAKNNTIDRNLISNNQIGLYLVENAADNKIIDNQILNNSTYGIYSKTLNGHINYLGDNKLAKNGKDLYPGI